MQAKTLSPPRVTPIHGYLSERVTRDRHGIQSSAAACFSQFFLMPLLQKMCGRRMTTENERQLDHDKPGADHVTEAGNSPFDARFVS